MKTTDNESIRSEQLSHLIRGHRNAQETIRAMDVKSSILFIFASIVLTGNWKIFEAIQKVAENCCSSCPESATQIGAVFSAASFLFGCAALIFCLLTLFARGKPVLPTTVLFPYMDSDKDGTKADYLNKAVMHNGINEQLIFEEYHDQLIVLGRILGKKIACNRAAVCIFMFEIVATMFAGIAFGIATFFC